MGLKYDELNRLLHKAVPFKNSWVKEAYGPHNTRLNPRKGVERALYCVTPTEGVVKQFKDGDYDILLTHHPFIVGVPQWIAHTALDCGPGGLNDQWRDLYGVKNARHFDGNLGWVGEIEPTSLQDLIKKAEDFVGRPLLGEHHGHEHNIRSMAICTGLGGMVEYQASKLGADCYVIGEATRHHKDSLFKARIETGHTLSEHGTGLNFFRKHLEPHGIVVDPSNLDVDKYSGEVYNRPVYHPYFSDLDDGVGMPPSKDSWRRKGSVYVPSSYKGWGPKWREEAPYDADYTEVGAAEPWGAPNSDTPDEEAAFGNSSEEADFWASYWAKAKAGERKAPVVGHKPDPGDLRPVSTSIQGVSQVESEPEEPESVPENDPFHVKVPKGG